MQKLIHRHMVFVAVIFFLEIAGVATLFFIMDQGYLSSVINDILIAVIFFVILFNLIMFFLIMRSISRTKMKTDVSSLAVLGNDVQEAYLFAKIGLVITDINDEVIWINNIFESIQGSVIDRKIFEWKPELENLKSQKVPQLIVHINNRAYEVKYLDKARLYIFKDVTDKEEFHQYTIDYAPAMGLIQIDNYQDLANTIDEVSINDNLVNIQKSIMEYAKKYNLLLRKLKTDTYLFICHHKDYDNLVKDKLSIIQNVREEGNDNSLTLSIGLSSGIDDYGRLYEYASTALDVALSRGGNQGVVSSYGSNLEFIGGKTEAKEKKNSVQARVLANTLKTMVEHSTSVYIMGHAVADLDAIGASLAAYAFASQYKQGKKVHIVYDEDNVEPQARMAMKRLFSKAEMDEITVPSAEALENFTDNTLLIVVDVHQPDRVMSPALAKRAVKVAVIDHHRRGENCIERNGGLNYIEPSASSASELLTEMIQYAPTAIDVPENFATMMLAGILLDTNHYTNHTGAKTYDASYILKNYGADNLKADSFLKIGYEEYILKTKMMANSIMPHTGILVACAEPDDIVAQASLSRVAVESLSISGINACFVIGKTSDKTFGISSRSDGTVSCQLICEKLHGGGSFTAAAASFKISDYASLNAVKNKLLDVLDSYLEEARQRKE